MSADIDTVRQIEWLTEQVEHLKSLPRVQTDAWIPASGWVYASATSFTVPGIDATGTFKTGITKIKYNDGAVDFGTVLSSSYAGGNTTVNSTPNADYSIADPGGSHVLTGCYYSYGNPPDFPGAFNWVPALNLGTAILSGYNSARFEVRGHQCHIDFDADNKTLSGTSGTIKIGLPIPSSVNYYGNTHAFICVIFQGTYIPVRNDLAVASNYFAIYKDITSGVWAANETGVYVRVHGEYEI
jgi:hypothetical protein